MGGALYKTPALLPENEIVRRNDDRARRSFLIRWGETDLVDAQRAYAEGAGARIAAKHRIKVDVVRSPWNIGERWIGPGERIDHADVFHTYVIASAAVGSGGRIADRIDVTALRQVSVVRTLRIGVSHYFIEVDHPVPIAVGEILRNQRIGAAEKLNQVIGAVPVGIAHAGIGAEHALLTVVEPVAVRIL